MFKNIILVNEERSYSSDKVSLYCTFLVAVVHFYTLELVKVRFFAFQLLSAEVDFYTLAPTSKNGPPLPPGLKEFVDLF